MHSSLSTLSVSLIHTQTYLEKQYNVKISKVLIAIHSVMFFGMWSVYLYLCAHLENLRLVKLLYQISVCNFLRANIYKFIDIFNIKFFINRQVKYLLLVLQYYVSLIYVNVRGMYSRSNKKRNTPIYFNTNYHTRMKMVPIIMDQCLL